MTHCWRRVYADCRLIIVVRQTFGKKILQNAEELLRTSLWGQSLTADEMSRALAGTCERAYAAGAFICMKGDPVDSWMGIIDGLGKMASHWTTGKTTSLIGIGSGAVSYTHLTLPTSDLV